MSNTKVLGFNLRLTLGTKTIAGVTSDSFNIEANRRESIMKDDAGNKQYEAIGRKITMSATLYIMHGTGTTTLNIDDIRKAVAAGTEFAYVYGGTTATNPTVVGNCVILKCSETSDSEGYATATVELEELEATGTGFSTVGS